MPDTLFHTTPSMSPAELESITGLSPEMQRDWRRRGYINEKLGTLQENGRWLYDWSDALFLCIMQQLYSAGVELPVTQRATNTVMKYVWFAAMRNWRIFDHPEKHRHFVMFKSTEADPEIHGGWATLPINDLSKCSAGPAAILIDVKHIALCLPEEFKPVMTKGAIITMAMGEDAD